MQKLLVGGDPLYLKFWIKVTALVGNRRLSIYFGLTIGAKMIGGGRPLLLEILSQRGRIGPKFEL